MPLLHHRQLIFLLLHHLIRMPQGHAVQIQLRLHRRDRLLVLLNHGPHNLLVLARPTAGASGGARAFA
jgi:hypothetical protein